MARDFLKAPATGLGYCRQVIEVPHRPDPLGRLQKVQRWLRRRLA